MPYTPPAGNAADLALTGAAYTPPAGNAANIEFVEGALAIGVLYTAEAANTLSATGTASRIGVFVSTEGIDTLSATGEGSPISIGDASITEGVDVLTGIGIAIPLAFGTASITEAPNTLTTDTDVAVKGNLSKTEAPNTLSSLGYINFNIQLSLLASNGALTFQRKTFTGSNGYIIAAPYVYVDSASSLGALSAFPLSTGVSLGAKYLYSADALHHFLYWECTQAGTTGGSHLTATPQDMGVEKTSGTAKFKVRRHHGWSRARTAVVADLLNQNPLPSNSFVYTAEWTMFLASSHAQTFAANVTLKMAEKCNFSASNAPGHVMISVDKSVAIPVTMTAGASLLGTGDAKGIQISSDTQDEGLVRGVTIGHDNTASSAIDRYDVFDPPNDVRLYDCTFQTYRQNNAYGGGATEYGIGATARHDVRSTYASLRASDPAPAIGMRTAGNIFIEAPTISRLTSATTPVIRAATMPNGFWPNSDTVIIGADLSSFTGGPAYKAEHTTAAVMKDGGSFRTLGVHMASGAITLPAVPPMDLAFSTLGSTAVGEFRWGDDVLITDGLDNDTDQNPANEPLITYASMSREATIVRTGGASDALGNFSYKTEVRNRWHYPYKFEFFNSKIDESFLITLHFIWSSTGSGLALLRDEDVWLEAAFLNHATKNSAELVFSFDKYNRRGLIFNDSVGPPTLDTSSEMWGGSVSGAVKQKVSIIVSPKKVGPVKVWVGLWLCPYTWHLASVTSVPIYICPRPILSAAP